METSTPGLTADTPARVDLTADESALVCESFALVMVFSRAEGIEDPRDRGAVNHARFALRVADAVGLHQDPKPRTINDREIIDALRTQWAVCLADSNDDGRRDDFDDETRPIALKIEKKLNVDRWKIARAQGVTLDTAGVAVRKTPVPCEADDDAATIAIQGLCQAKQQPGLSRGFAHELGEAQRKLTAYWSETVSMVPRTVEREADPDRFFWEDVARLTVRHNGASLYAAGRLLLEALQKGATRHAPGYTRELGGA